VWVSLHWLLLPFASLTAFQMLRELTTPATC
jgi:hypothetical protein